MDALQFAVGMGALTAFAVKLAGGTDALAMWIGFGAVVAAAVVKCAGLLGRAES